MHPIVVGALITLGIVVFLVIAAFGSLLIIAIGLNAGYRGKFTR